MMLIPGFLDKFYAYLFADYLSKGLPCKFPRINTYQIDDRDQNYQIQQVESTDRLSGLPECLLHEILKYLPITDARQTSFLSRRWRYTWHSCPSYRFDEYHFREKYGMHNKMFKTFVDDTLQCRERYFPNLFLEFLKLEMDDIDNEYYALDDWVNYALEKKVKQLDIRIENFYMRHNLLPTSVFASETLNVLKISTCNFAWPDFVHLPNLQHLTLHWVSVNDEALVKILGGCPGINSLCLAALMHVKNFTIRKPKLEVLQLVSGDDEANVTVETSNLQSVFLSNIVWNNVNVSSSGHIKTLALYHVRKFSDEALKSLIVHHPFIENLHIEGCYDLKISVITSPLLKSLYIAYCIDLEEVSIDAPSLRRFEYRGDLISFSDFKSSHQLKCIISASDSEDHEDTSLYDKLKKMYETFNHSIALTLCSTRAKFLVIPSHMREKFLPQLGCLNHLKVELEKSEMDTQELKNGLLWIFPNLKSLEIIDAGFRVFKQHYS
ncbi:hypothetical protein LIER_04406 [Lithospermum erythrorhizon]|uniref:F-box domain-containing protein n=1 Tax=Lithospermum erythrorhizon TaxID=34254 RepID=A0AAV3NXF9_LITER